MSIIEKMTKIDLRKDFLSNAIEHLKNEDLMKKFLSEYAELLAETHMSGKGNFVMTPGGTFLDTAKTAILYSCEYYGYDSDIFKRWQSAIGG